eukprot:PRCOL_00006828-RA
MGADGAAAAAPARHVRALAREALARGEAVHMDMTRPLSEYFISSSHNTYLTGNQLTSDSSPAAVSAALLAGYRVVELDVWPSPDGKGGEPMVLHGHTLTRPCTFRSCVAAVAEHAFAASPYPVIITLENHCKEADQQAMANILVEELGELLHVPEDADGDAVADAARELLSPEALRGKVIVRDKPAKGKEDVAEMAAASSESAAHILTMDSTPGGPGQLPEGLRGVIPPEDEEEVNLEGSLKRLVYIRNEKFVGFAEADATEHVVSSSFSEHKMGKVLRGKYSERADVDGAGEGAAGEASAAASKPSAKLAATRKWWSMKGPKEDEWAGAADVLEYSRRHVARVYPGGERVDSSNYDPTPLWCVGCQVVALNAQGRDKPTWRNAGKFLANGACGYVLKPHYMRQAQGKGDASAGAGWLPDAPGRARVRLRVKVLSATGYTGGWGFEGKPDLYTKLEVNGVPADCAKCQTRVIANDAAPSWNRAFAFDLAAPELAVLTLQVKESDYVNSDFMGQVALPVGELREGKLALPLLGRKGAPSARFGAPILHVEVAKEDLAQKRAGRAHSLLIGGAEGAGAAGGGAGCTCAVS